MLQKNIVRINNTIQNMFSRKDAKTQNVDYQ
jgi:hypothetical protein